MYFMNNINFIQQPKNMYISNKVSNINFLDYTF